LPNRKGVYSKDSGKENQIESVQEDGA